MFLHFCPLSPSSTALLKLFLWYLPNLLTLLTGPVKAFDTISLTFLVDIIADAVGCLAHIPTAHLWLRLWWWWNVLCTLSAPTPHAYTVCSLLCLKAFSEAAVAHPAGVQAQQRHSRQPLTCGKQWIGKYPSLLACKAQIEAYFTSFFKGSQQHWAPQQ